MNKSILKHEIRSMKWMTLASLTLSVVLVMMFSRNIDNRYAEMFYSGLSGNQAVIQQSLRYISDMVLILFSSLAVLQVFMQFRSEKDQEVGRFLKSLPVKNEEFLKVKLISGLANLSLAFAVLFIGMIMVRRVNMFWIADIYSISNNPLPFMEVDGILSILKELGLIYLIVLSFYTFLIMVQYTFTNLIGGIVTGILVWLAPIFILLTSAFTLERFISSSLTNRLFELSDWVLPWIYPFRIDYNTLNMNPNSINGNMIGIIDHLAIKYIICLGLIAVNIFLAYRFNKDSKIEDENKVIRFKSTRNIFKIGVTICSALLASAVFTDFLMVDISDILYLAIMILGGSIGYFISMKIAKVGN